MQLATALKRRGDVGSKTELLKALRVQASPLFLLLNDVHGVGLPNWRVLKSLGASNLTHLQSDAPGFATRFCVHLSG